jgi:hypothetical protein
VTHDTRGALNRPHYANTVCWAVIQRQIAHNAHHDINQVVLLTGGIIVCCTRVRIVPTSRYNRSGAAEGTLFYVVLVNAQNDACSPV